MVTLIVGVSLFFTVVLVLAGIALIKARRCQVLFEHYY